jgi:NADH-quinone oxidoreductase subunit L
MTHAFFKALLFLCSGAVIHGMAGEQDMRRMGDLRKYLPVTFATMMIGTLAIAGIPPLSGFFSKDEILYRTFLHNKVLWSAAAVTALMTAFYMFRLMSMTFFGTYRGPAWDHGGGHGQGHGAHDDGAASSHASAGHGGGGTSHAVAGHGGGGWHGPHEAPRSMTVPLMALAVGAIIAGFIGVPKVLGGSNVIEQFLEPSFTARAITAHASPESGMGTAHSAAVETAPASHGETASSGATTHGSEPAETETGGGHLSTAGELGLMALSVLIAIVGISTAWRFYVRAPEIAEHLARQWSGAHRVLLNKYYVDELYDATVIRGTMASATGLWAFDAKVVDGAVNGAGWLTIFFSWFSHLIDKYIVDGLVNFVGAAFEESSFALRRVQTGLIQNYALVMVFGVFAFVSMYLFVR